MSAGNAGNAVVTQTVVAGTGSEGTGSAISSIDALSNAGSSATVLVPTQTVVTVTVSGGAETLSTSSGAITRTVFVSPSAPAPTHTHVVTVTQGAPGGQCQASTVTVCATNGVCPSGALKF